MDNKLLLCYSNCIYCTVLRGISLQLFLDLLKPTFLLIITKCEILYNKNILYTRVDNTVDYAYVHVYINVI